MKPPQNVLKEHRVTSPIVITSLWDFLRKCCRALWAHQGEINRQPPSHGLAAPSQAFPLMAWANCNSFPAQGALQSQEQELFPLESCFSCSPCFHHQTGGCSATPMVIFDQRQRVLICHLSPAKSSLPFGCQLVFHGIVPGYVYGSHLHQHSHTSHIC